MSLTAKIILVVIIIVALIVTLYFVFRKKDQPTVGAFAKMNNVTVYNKNNSPRRVIQKGEWAGTVNGEIGNLYVLTFSDNKTGYVTKNQVDLIDSKAGLITQNQQQSTTYNSVIPEAQPLVVNENQEAISKIIDSVSGFFRERRLSKEEESQRRFLGTYQ